MKKMMNIPQAEQYDGTYQTKQDGIEIIKAVAVTMGWPANIMTLEIDSWINRF